MNLAAGDAVGQFRIMVFLKALQQLGWTDGGNVRIDVRWPGSDLELGRTHAAELIALEPDVVLASTSRLVTALQQATRTVPIVFVNAVDPVGSGIVASLARPGGNVTGFILFEYALAAKWLQLLKEIAPNVTRTAFLRHPTLASGVGQFAAIQTVGSIDTELAFWVTRSATAESRRPILEDDLPRDRQTTPTRLMSSMKMRISFVINTPGLARTDGARANSSDFLSRRLSYVEDLAR
jgi:hypothetical protein